MNFSARRAHGGFTMIELLIVIGIVGTLASMMLNVIGPRKTLLAARDVERAMNEKTYHAAMTQYQLYESFLPHQSELPSGIEHAMQICTRGVTNNANCLDMSMLAPEYIADLPRDFAEPCPDFTGYGVYLQQDNIGVVSLHRGKMPGDENIIVTPGCTGSSSSSSYAHDASSSTSFSMGMTSVAASEMPSSAWSSSSSAFSFGFSSDDSVETSSWPTMSSLGEMPSSSSSTEPCLGPLPCTTTSIDQPLFSE